MLKRELEATILVNPRKNQGEYTKYSFPSKVLEYMSTGTTILMNKLDGIPNDYYNNVLLFNLNIKDTLKEINMMPIDEIESIGKRAKEWVLNNKEIHVVSEKVFNFINSD